jgi:hypothetical protein
MRKVLGIAVFSGMLGVTLFGIFLTPVFFYVIEGFIDNPLFSSKRAQEVGLVLRHILGTLTLGLFWLPALLVRGLRRWPRRRIDLQKRPRAAATGHGRASRVSGNGKAHNGDAAPDGDPGYALRK